MEPEQLLEAGGIEAEVAAGVGLQPGAGAAVLIQLAAQQVVAPVHLHQPQGESNGGVVLAGHVHQLPAHHAVGIHNQIVEGLAFGWGAGDRTDRFGQIEDRNQPGIAAGLLAQALLTWAHSLVAVDVEPDGGGALLAQLADGIAEEAIIDRPAVEADVLLADADQGDRRAGACGSGPNVGDQVVKQQVQGFGDAAEAQPYHQQQRAAEGSGQPQALAELVPTLRRACHGFAQKRY